MDNSVPQIFGTGGTRDKPRKPGFAAAPVQASPPALQLPATISVRLELGNGEAPVIMRKLKTAASPEGNLRLAPLLTEVLDRGGGDFDFAGQIIRYWSSADNEVVFVGKWPIPESCDVECGEIDFGSPFRIIVTPPKDQQRLQQRPSGLPASLASP